MTMLMVDALLVESHVLNFVVSCRRETAQILQLAVVSHQSVWKKRQLSSNYMFDGEGRFLQEIGTLFDFVAAMTSKD